MGTVREAYEAKKKRSVEEPKDCLAKIATKVAIGGLLLNFVSLGVAALALKSSRAALVTANRAWIAPRGIDLTTPLEAGKDLHFNAYFANGGNSPAAMVSRFEVAVIANPSHLAATGPVFFWRQSHVRRRKRSRRNYLRVSRRGKGPVD